MLNLLAVTWDVNPFIFTIGDFDIRWYSLFFVAGIFPIGYYIMRSFYKREGLPTESLDPLLIALFIGTIAGARLGHCLFYDPEYYLSHPWKILMIREGGLASHGGAIGVLLAMWWYVHKYGKKYGVRIYPDHRPSRNSRLLRRNDDTPWQPHELRDIRYLHRPPVGIHIRKRPLD